MNITGVLREYSIIILYIFSAFLSGILAYIAGRRMDRSHIRFFAMILWLEFLWTLFCLFELISSDINAKAFWDNLQFPVSLSAAVMLFFFARRITGQPGTIHKWNGLLFFPPVASLLLAFTDPLHGLMRLKPFLDTSVPFGEFVYGFTVLDYLLFSYSYGLLLFSIVFLLRYYPSGSSSVRRRYDLVLIGFLIPIFGTILAVFDIRIFGRRDISPIWFTLGNAFIFVTFFRFHLFGIIPIARKVLVDSFGDPIIVFDSDGLLLDCNRAFSGLSGSSPRKMRGRHLKVILTSWPEVADLFNKSGNVSMIGEDGITVSDVRNDRTYRVSITSIYETAENSGIELGKVALFRDITEIAVIEKQLQDWNSELQGRIASRLKDLNQEIEHRKAAEAGLRRVSKKIVKSQQDILVTLSDVVENRSPETANHVLRVGEYARILAVASGMSPEDVALIVDAAPLHDVGKIAIPDFILNKNGPLTIEEMTIMKTHTTVGYKILGSSERSIIRSAAVIALNHHEHWNGKGYPAGLAGENIPISGRIVCICDVYDALATTRSYKKPWEKNRILDFFSSESGKMFDPSLVELLLSNADKFSDVTERLHEVSGKPAHTYNF